MHKRQELTRKTGGGAMGTEAGAVAGVVETNVLFAADGLVRALIRV